MTTGSLSLADSSSESVTFKSSVYRINPAVDGAIVGTTALGSFLAYAYSDKLIHPRCPCDTNEINSFDRGVVGNANDFTDHLSDVTVAAAVVFPVVLDWRDVGLSKEFAEDMAVYAETLSVNGSLVTLAKYTVQRPLPRTYAGDPNLVNNPRGYRSFYSGHTSVSVSALSTAAMTYSLRHPGSYWPWIVTGVVGATVAYERVAAGRHFYTDVIVGAAAGSFVGIAVPHFHLRDRKPSSTFGVAPLENGVVTFWKMNY